MLKGTEGLWIRELEQLPLHAVLVLIREGLFCLGSTDEPQARGCAEAAVQHLTLCLLEGLFADDDSTAQASLKGLLPTCIGAANRLGPPLQSWVADLVERLAW